MKYKSPDYYQLDDLLTDEHKLIRGAIRGWVNVAVMPIIDEDTHDMHLLITGQDITGENAFS